MVTTVKSWAELTPEEKRQRRYDSWLNPEGVEFVSPEAEATYKARATRVADAYSLRTPDRVPVSMNMGWYPVAWAGLSPYEAMHDYGKAADAYVRFNRHFQADVMANPIFMTLPGRAFDLLEYRLYHWPGHGTPKDAGFQYNEDEWMKPEEYDHLIEDPTDFFYSVYLPRISGAYEMFSHLGSAFDLVEMPFGTLAMGPWAAPGVKTSFEKLVAAGQEVGAWAGAIFPAVGTLQADGFIQIWGGASKAPFDFIGDSLRGTRGMLLDLYREPEKVLAACDRLAPLMVRWTLRRATPSTIPGIFIPLHKGADGFMSLAQFETFYWPSLRKVILGLIEEGFTPFLFAEGRYGSRLETICDLPKGKTVWLFDQTDMARAKETIGQVACIQGNVQLSLAHAGTPEQVTAYCRELIETAGKDGGYILDFGGVLDSAKPENVEAVVKAAKDLGVY